MGKQHYHTRTKALQNSLNFLVACIQDSIGRPSKHIVSGRWMEKHDIAQVPSITGSLTSPVSHEWPLSIM